MAQTQHCDTCGEEPAVITIITNESGDVIMIGASCMPIFYLTASAEILDAMPEENRAAYAEVLQPITEKLAAIDGRAGEDITGPGAAAYGAPAAAAGTRKNKRAQASAVASQEGDGELQPQGSANAT